MHGLRSSFKRSRWVAMGAAIAVVVGAGGLMPASADLGSGDRPVLVSITPCRLADTRAPDNVGTRTTPLGQGETHVLTVRGANGNCTIPNDALAVVINVAAISPTAGSFFTLFPSDQTRPLSANLNWVGGQPPVSNGAVIKLSGDGKMSIYNLAGTVHFAIDILGYFVGANFDDRYYTKAQIDARQWTSANIADGTIALADLAPNSVDGSKVVDGSITAADLNLTVSGSPQILDGSVSAVDLANNSVTSAKVLDETLTAADLGPNSVGSSEVIDQSLGTNDIGQLDGDADIIDNSITTFDIASNAIDSDEVVDFGLSNQDVGVLFAQVNADGTIANSSGGVTGAKLGTGTYEVDFGVDISFCAYVSTQGEATPGGAPGAITGATDRSGNAEAVFATVRTAADALIDRAFQLVVVC